MILEFADYFGRSHRNMCFCIPCKFVMLKNNNPMYLTIDICCEGSVIILDITASIGFALCHLNLRNFAHMNPMIISHNGFCLMPPKLRRREFILGYHIIRRFWSMPPKPKITELLSLSLLDSTFGTSCGHCHQ